MSLRVSRGDLRALSGALTEISAGVSKIASLSRVPRRCICGHMWTLNSLPLENIIYIKACVQNKAQLCASSACISGYVLSDKEQN